MVLPFILSYFLIIPWRLDNLFSIALTQYERVPTQKVKGAYFTREIKDKKLPKRVEVVMRLFECIFKDYVTILFSLILVVTMWRSINTIQKVWLYFRYRISNNQQEKDYIEIMIKD